MKINNIYIISFMPQNETREKRFEIHRRQLDYWKKTGLTINVLAMGYEEGDYDEGVNYIAKDQLRPGPARNECLKLFYQTDDDFTLIMDNDMILYEGPKYCDSDNLMEILQKIPIENLEGVDAFQPLNPTQTPFSDFYAKNKGLLEENLVFRRHPNLSGACIFLRNFKKFYGVEYYYEDWHDHETGKVIMGEDVAFGIELVKNGLGVFCLTNAVRKDMGWSVSSWCKNPEQRKQAFEELKRILPELGIPTKGDRMLWAAFADRYGHPKQIIAPKKLVRNLEEFF